MFLPVVVLSESDHHAAVRAAMDLGASAVFVKELQDVSNRASLDYYLKFIDTLTDVTEPLDERRRLRMAWDRYWLLEWTLYTIDHTRGLLAQQPHLAFDSITRCFRKAFSFADRALQGTGPEWDRRGTALLSTKGEIDPTAFPREAIVWAEAAIARMVDAAWIQAGLEPRDSKWPNKVRVLKNKGLCTWRNPDAAYDEKAAHFQGAQDFERVIKLLEAGLEFCDEALKAEPLPPGVAPEIATSLDQDLDSLRKFEVSLDGSVCPVAHPTTRTTSEDVTAFLCAVARHICGLPDFAIGSLAAAPDFLGQLAQRRAMQAPKQQRFALYLDDEIHQWGRPYEYALRKSGYKGSVRLHSTIPSPEVLGQADFVILDLFWTDDRGAEGGLERLEAIIKACPVLPVIILTRSGEARHVMRATRRGAYAYVVRPHLSDELDTSKEFFRGLKDLVKNLEEFRAHSDIRNAWRKLRALEDKPVTSPVINPDRLNTKRQIIQDALSRALFYACLHQSRLEQWKMTHLIFPGKRDLVGLAAHIFWYCGVLAEASLDLMQGVPGVPAMPKRETAERVQDLIRLPALGGPKVWQPVNRARRYRNHVLRQGRAAYHQQPCKFLVEMIQWTHEFYNFLGTLNVPQPAAAPHTPSVP